MKIYILNLGAIDHRKTDDTVNKNNNKNREVDWLNQSSKVTFDGSLFIRKYMA